MYGEMVLQDGVVPKMTVCVTFGASRIGANFRNVCALSEYVTFSTISATAVRKMAVCVTFGALRCGAKFRHICVRSDYATFCTISATAVREMTVCVMFCAPHFGFFIAMWGHPAVDQIGSVLLGTGFRHLWC